MYVKYVYIHTRIVRQKSMRKWVKNPPRVPASHVMVI
jgi:hypothetical protein